MLIFININIIYFIINIDKIKNHNINIEHMKNL